MLAQTVHVNTPTTTNKPNQVGIICLALRTCPWPAITGGMTKDSRRSRRVRRKAEGAVGLTSMALSMREGSDAKVDSMRASSSEPV